MTGKVALITRITRQDGAYLSEHLLSKGYVVHGIKRTSSFFNTGRIAHLYQYGAVKISVVTVNGSQLRLKTRRWTRGSRHRVKRECSAPAFVG